MINARLMVGILAIASGSAAIAAKPTPDDYIDTARHILDPDRAGPRRVPHGDAALIPYPGVSDYAPREHVRSFEMGPASAELATYNIRRGSRAGDIATAREGRAHARGATFSARQDIGAGLALIGQINVQQLRERAAGSPLAARPNDIRDASAGFKLVPRGWPALGFQIEHLAVAGRTSDFDRIALLGTTPAIAGNGVRFSLSGGSTNQRGFGWDMSLRALKADASTANVLSPALPKRDKAATLNLHYAF